MQKLKKGDLGKRLAEEGIDLVLQNAGEDWCDAAMKKLRRWCARSTDAFAFEDFRLWAVRTGLPAPHSSNAWGGIAQAAVRMGLLVKTRRYRPAKSPLTHGHPVRLWIAGRSA